jgi:hypothetical protein
MKPYLDVSFLTFFGLTSPPLIYTSLSLCSRFLFVTFRATTFQSSAVRFLRNFHFEKRSSYCALLCQVSVRSNEQGGVYFPQTYLAKNWCTFAISSLTFSRARFLSRYSVCMISLNGSQIGSTVHASVNGIDMAERFGRLQFTRGEEGSFGGILESAAACYS